MNEKIVGRVFQDKVPQYVSPAWVNDVVANGFAGSVNLDGSEQRRQLESELGELFAMPCRMVKSGTQALTLALRAVGVRPGDKVATAAWTCPATCSAIIDACAQPVFVDVDVDTWTMDVNDLKSVIADVTAVVPVDLFGRPCDITGVRSVACDKPIVRDACQALGGAGIVSPDADVVCASLYPTKPFGGLTEGGVVFTVRDDVLETVHVLAEQGQYGERRCDGVNGRFGELEAMIYRQCLPRIRRYAAKSFVKAETVMAALPANWQTQALVDGQVVHMVRFIVPDDAQRTALARLISQNETYQTAVSVMPVYAGRRCDTAERLAAQSAGVILYDALNVAKVVAALQFVHKSIK